MELFDKKFVYLEWDDVLEGKEVFIADTLPQLRLLVGENCDSLQEVSKNVDEDSFWTFIAPCGTHYAMVYYDPNYECKVAYAQGKVIQCKSSCIPNDKWEDCVCSPEWADHCEYRVKPEEHAVIPEMWTTCIDDEGVVSVIPSREWNKNKGRQLIEGTNEECQCYAVENYCARCAYKASCVHQKCTMKINAWYCQGFKELVEVKKRRMTNRELAKWIAEGNGLARFMPTGITGIDYTYSSNEEDASVSDTWKICGWDEKEWHVPEVEG